MKTASARSQNPVAGDRNACAPSRRRGRTGPCDRLRADWALGVALSFVLWNTGCDSEKIEVYTAAKDKPAPATAARSASSPSARARPQLRWQLPAGWRELGPGQMSLASFQIEGEGGGRAQVTVTPLAKLGGREVEVVNMWREQLGLEPLGREEIERQFENVTVGGEPGRLFAVDGAGADRIVTAIVHRPEASWFYKLAGDAKVVTAQKAAFVEFLRTVQIQEGAPDESSGGDSEPKPVWQVPSSWRELPAGQMQLAKFAVPARGPAKAEVSISRFPNDTGGTLANVNRWRRQLGLAEVAETELAGMVSALGPSHPEGKLVDLTHEQRRLVGVIVPRSGAYWFYKLMGDAEAVAPEKDAFVRFAQSNP